jgi:hypothetical protein
VFDSTSIIQDFAASCGRHFLPIRATTGSDFRQQPHHFVRLTEGRMAGHNDAEQFSLDGSLVALERDAARFASTTARSPRTSGQRLERIIEALLIACAIALTQIPIEPCGTMFKSGNSQFLDQRLNAP